MQNTTGTELEVIPPTAIAPADVPGWDRARHWLNIAVHFEFRRVVAQVMVGFEVMAMHSELGVQRGGDRAKSHSDSLLFKQLVEKELKIPHATAYRWMRMAKKVREQAGKLLDAGEVLTLLERPVRGWTSENCSAVFDYVERITAEKTQAQLLAAGGKKQLAPKPNPEEKARLRENKGRLLKARQAWEEAHQQLQAYGDQFTILPDTIIIEQAKALEVMAMARVMWTKYPTDLRTLELSDDIFRRAVVQIECENGKRKK